VRPPGRISSFLADGNGNFLVAALDAATLSTTDPEPASLVLLAAPVLGLALARRRS